MTDSRAGILVRIPHRWWKIIPGEAKANGMNPAQFVWVLAKLGYEVYRDQNMRAKLKRAA